PRRWARFACAALLVGFAGAREPAQGIAVDADSQAVFEFGHVLTKQVLTERPAQTGIIALNVWRFGIELRDLHIRDAENDEVGRIFHRAAANCSLRSLEAALDHVGG